MPEKNWSQIVAELRGLKNRIVATEDSPDVEFFDIMDCLDDAADALEERYRRSGE